MRKWLRRIRGAMGMGLTWAAGWAPVGAAIGLVLGVVYGGPSLGAVVVRNLVTFGVLGFVGGGIFSAVLRIAAGNRRFDQLTLRGFAVWGALGGLALGALATAAGLYGAGVSAVGLIVTGASTLLGMASATGSLALARKADEAALPPGAMDAGDVGLTRKEKRELLGSTR